MDNIETDSDFWKNKGNEFYKKGNFEEAITCYKKAIKINPKSGSAYHNLGLVYRRLGDSEKSKFCFAKAEKLRSPSKPTLKSPKNNGPVKKIAIAAVIGIILVVIAIIALSFIASPFSSVPVQKPNTPIQTITPPSQTTIIPTIAATTNPGSPLPTQPPAGKTSGLLTVRYLDVGQGDSMLIQTPSGKNMLIDAGPTDAGSTVTSDLKGLGINTLDIVLATHPHEDHIGGMSSVLNNFNVKQFIDSGYPHTTKTYETMLNTIDQKNIPFKTVKAGDTINLDPGLTISVLNPTSKFSDDINQNSVVLKMTYGGVSFLFMGDANADAESKIANSGTNLQADILKVGHHGSATSTSSAFLTKVHPKISVIEVGAGNSYGHPTSATLGRLAQVGSAVYRTDLNGDVTVTTDEMTYQSGR